MTAHLTPADCTYASERATEFTLQRVIAESALLVATSEIHRAAPDWDNAYDFAERAMRAIETLRILAASIARSSLVAVGGQA